MKELWYSKAERRANHADGPPQGAGLPEAREVKGLKEGSSAQGELTYSGLHRGFLAGCVTSAQRLTLSDFQCISYKKKTTWYLPLCSYILLFMVEKVKCQ